MYQIIQPISVFFQDLLKLHPKHWEPHSRYLNSRYYLRLTPQETPISEMISWGWWVLRKRTNFSKPSINTFRIYTSIPTTLWSLLPKALFQIFWTALTGSPRILFVPDTASSYVLFFRLLSFQLSVMLSRKLLFTPLQFISLKTLSCFLLSANTRFVTFSCTASLSVFLRCSLQYLSHFITTFVSSILNDSIKLFLPRAFFKFPPFPYLSIFQERFTCNTLHVFVQVAYVSCFRLLYNHG